ncbi:ER-derived vesicles protein Erv46p [Trichomonascus vanleenenianus]|uniref:retrograde cargo receptor ERV46 n=1 Tax=Trichomonascus vanleenenianus TaxID=2268995 RepID=UPI003ECA447D
MLNRRLLSFDAFSKTVEDARIRTASGGLVTIVSLVVIAWLTISEFLDYRAVVYRPELIVDKARSERLSINLDITFPNMPCDLVSMDIMDAAGEVQEEIEHGIVKTRLDAQGNAISSSALELMARQHEEAEEKTRDPNYCGSCYGAKPEGECCNTCEEVKRAYREIGWAFHDGSGIEQCEKEHYNLKLHEVKNEGCNIAGHVSVNKVEGNFHFAPGASFTRANQHSHDLSLFSKEDMPFRLSHVINHLSFGPEVEGQAIQNPLDSTLKVAEEKLFNYHYFIKVVATRFERLSGEVVETNQYSVTSHERSIVGGRDEDHPNTMHRRGGIPGVFFSYDISPMKVINREQRSRSFGAFLTGVCAIVGGVITVGAIVDKGVWEADKALRRKKNL